MSLWGTFRSDDILGSLLDMVVKPFADDPLEYFFDTKIRILSESEKYVIRAETPGLTKDDVKITVENGTISVKSEKKTEHKKDDYFSARCDTFERNWSLPADAVVDGIEADMKNGILVVTIPKSKKEIKSKTIEIK